MAGCLEVGWGDRMLIMNLLVFFDSALKQDILSMTFTMQNHWQGLLQFILTFLSSAINASQEELEQEGKSLYLIIRDILQKITQQYHTLCFQSLIDFVYQYIVSPQLEQRVAAMLVFEATLHSGSREEIQMHLTKGYDSFFSLFSDQSLIIQKYNLIVFQSLLKYHSYAL